MAPIAHLLLREGHTAPIYGLSPDALKRSAREVSRVPHEHLKHTQCLNAIVERLGFSGGFAAYQTSNWPSIERFMREHGLGERGDLFPPSPGQFDAVSSRGERWDLMPYGVNRRNLADRLANDPPQGATRVFLGYGIDWAPFNAKAFATRPLWSGDRLTFDIADSEAAETFLMRSGLRTVTAGFLDNRLFDNQHKPCSPVVNKIYHLPSADPEDLRVEAARTRAAVAAFQYVIEAYHEGWVEMLHCPGTDRVTFLRANDGSWDLVWRDLRTQPRLDLSRRDITVVNGLDSQDTPQRVWDTLPWQEQNDRRLGAWDEKERHDAEQFYYDNGGQPFPYYPGGDVVLKLYLDARGVKIREQPARRVPRATGNDGGALDGFRRVQLPKGNGIYVSEMVTRGQFERAAHAANYWGRRRGEGWKAANPGNVDEPAGVTWLDALAYCAWTERPLGLRLRLLTREEHRALRPFTGPHYENMSGSDFPWEKLPPRVQLASAVRWSEERFVPETPELRVERGDGGWSRTSRKRWIDAERWPPTATWVDPLPWANHGGLRFIDAWDAYEWTDEGWISGLYWEGYLGSQSWGEYKNVKVGFRLVVDSEGQV